MSTYITRLQVLTIGIVSRKFQPLHASMISSCRLYILELTKAIFTDGPRDQCTILLSLSAALAMLAIYSTRFGRKFQPNLLL